MAYSLQLYTGDGSQTTFTFSFPYLEQSHVQVLVDGVDTSFSFLSANMISISPAPADGSVIEIKRVTPKTRLVDFLNGSIQDAEDFDLDSNQLLYIVLEGFDKATTNLSRVATSNDNKMYLDIDMNGYKILNSGAPTASTDLVRVSDLREYIREEALGYIVSEAASGDTITVELALELLDTYLASAQADAETAEANANAYTDTQIAAIDLSGITTNASAIVTNANAIANNTAAIVSNASSINALDTRVTQNETDIQNIETNYATNSSVSSGDSSTLQSANSYTDAAIAAIPTPSGVYAHAEWSYDAGGDSITVHNTGGAITSIVNNGIYITINFTSLGNTNYTALNASYYNTNISFCRTSSYIRVSKASGSVAIIEG